MFDLDLALRFGVAPGLSLLSGLERERKRAAELSVSGIRTFALIALTGALSAFMQHELDQSWLIIATFVFMGAPALRRSVVLATSLLLIAAAGGILIA